MIQRTFQHIPGVGPWRERDLWARGFETWDDFPAEGEGVAISERGDALARLKIDEARRALTHRDLGGLARLIPPREHWRLYPLFRDQAVFLDIEAEGESEIQPTVVGLFDSTGLHAFVRGHNLDSLPQALAGHPLWVTFNGSCFDLPILKRHFGDFPEPLAHVDLKVVCRRARLRGGLKSIEDELGLARPPHLRGVNGLQAVRLWRTYQATRDIEALRFLVEYNLYDAFQLRSVLEASYNRIVDAYALNEPRLQVFDRGDILYDLSRLLLDLEPLGLHPDYTS